MKKMQPRQVKIVSDGTVFGTSAQLTGGSIIPNVAGISVVVETYEGDVTATLSLAATPLELVALLKEAVVHYWKCPKCGKCWCSEYCTTCGIDLEDHEHAVRLTEFAEEEEQAG